MFTISRVVKYNVDSPRWDYIFAPNVQSNKVKSSWIQEVTARGRTCQWLETTQTKKICSNLPQTLQTDITMNLIDTTSKTFLIIVIKPKSTQLVRLVNWWFGT